MNGSIRKWVSLIGILVLIFACKFNTQKVSTIATPSEKPNILIVMPDQFRDDAMGCSGNPEVKTPNLDQMAAEGIRFTNSLSGGPVCCPSRATLQTGLYMHEHGVVRNNVLLDPKMTTIAELLVNEGYATGYIGKWHLDGGVPKEVGGYVEAGERRQGWQDWNGYEKSHEFFEVWQFDENKQKVRLEEYNWEPTWQTDMALKFMEKNTKEGTPWCYYISFGPPHKPEQCPQEYLDLYPQESLNLSKEITQGLSKKELEELKYLTQVYYGQVSAIDHEMGRLTRGMETLGIENNTIVIFISDHGDVLGTHALDIRARNKMEDNNVSNLRTKGKPFSTALRTPLIIKWPNKIKGGQLSDVLVNNVDVAPTLMELAGIKGSHKMSGQSMAPWCLGEKGPTKEALYLGLDDSKNAWRGIWDGRYLYADLSYQVLYDHQKDPLEKQNLFFDPNYSKLKASMKKQLIDLAEEVRDPIVERLKNNDSKAK